jgi:adenine-specific DNA-methyltransferase
VTRRLTFEEKLKPDMLPKGAQIYGLQSLKSTGYRELTTVNFEFKGNTYHPGMSDNWKTTIDGLKRLASLDRIELAGEQAELLAGRASGC